jgi:hypothetical protein
MGNNLSAWVCGHSRRRSAWLGVVAMTKPFATILAAGTLDRSGNLPIKIPVQGGVIQPGKPGQIDFLGASIDPQTLAVILTPTRSWPKN